MTQQEQEQLAGLALTLIAACATLDTAAKIIAASAMVPITNDVRAEFDDLYNSFVDIVEALGDLE